MIRKIQVEDAPALKHICETALGHTTTVDHLKQRIQELSHDPCYCIAVCEDDAAHQVLGFIQAEKYNLLYGGNGINIIALAVSPEAQRQGIGKQLLLFLEEQAAGHGDTFIRLNCNTVRTEAHAFYEHMGYTCDKTQKRFIRQIGR
ncbi:MAG: GNAT family N-acetyltransferase [Clostridia bacterium]|nr:GNAT family N-acetyltransferase [Clostridia bacterium]